MKVFWDANEIFFEKGQRSNRNYYVGQLVRLKKKKVKKLSHMKKKKVLSCQDYAPCYRVDEIQE